MLRHCRGCLYIQYGHNMLHRKSGSEKQSLPIVTDCYPLLSKCCSTDLPHKTTECYIKWTTAEMKVSSEQPMETNPVAKCFLHPRDTCTLSGKSLVSPWQVSQLSGKQPLPTPPIPERGTIVGFSLTLSSSFSYKEWAEQVRFSFKFMHCFLIFF